MALTTELQQLADLHSRGQLSDGEFAEAKARLIASTAIPTRLAAPPPGKDRAATGAAPAAASAAMASQTFWSSRWSKGNLFFRDRLTVGGDGLTFRKGAMFGSNEEHIAFHAIASLKVENGIFLANLTVETSGGSQPIFINGLWKSDARELQAIVRGYQAAHG